MMKRKTFSKKNNHISLGIQEHDMIIIALTFRCGWSK